MKHEDLAYLLKQSGDDFNMSSEIPERLLRRIAVRRFVTAGVFGAALFATVTGSVLAISSFDSDGSHPPADENETISSDVPDMAQVRCGPGGARALTAEVRPQDDGIHIMIDNQTNKEAFYIRDADLSNGNHGGRLQPHAKEEVISTFPPGRILVGCFENGRSTPYSEIAGQGFAELKVVDPEGIWVPATPDCAIPEQVRWEVTTEGISEDASFAEIAQMYLNVEDEDRVLPAGYPKTEWKLGPTFSVIRAGRPIAILSYTEGGDSSTIFVQTCAEGGIEPSTEDDPQPIEPSNSWVFYSDSENGFAIGYPEDWYRAEESLTPNLGDPKELVSVGTYDLVFRDTGCDHLPGSALEDLGADDALVSIQERAGDVRDYPSRPDDFETGAEPVGGFMCTPEGREVYWISFRDAGRGFYALLALGPEASEDTRAIAWDVLNSFEPEPAAQWSQIESP